MKWLWLVVLCTACGYKLATPGVASSYPKISVPYVKGDNTGKLTDYLVRELEMRGRLDYTDAASLTLATKIVTDQKERIGYRYDRKGTESNRISRLRPTESKRVMTVLVTLKDESTGKTIFGPKKVTARVDYDYVNFDTINDLGFTPSGGPLTSVLAFSLGQLDAVEGAENAALDPLYRKLAILIADGIDATSL